MIFPYQRITPAITRPIIPIILKSTDKFIVYSALIDSGADYCIFSIEIAKFLNIKLEPKKVVLKGIGSEKVKGYWGKIEIKIDETAYDLKAIFAAIGDFGHGILGQKGLFDHFDVKLSYNKQTIEISPI